MNVLGKLKSKKPKPDENLNLTQNIEKTQQKRQTTQPAEIKEKSFHTQEPKLKQNTSKIHKCTKPVQETQFIANTNVISKKKQIAIKEKDPGLIMTSNSMSNSFSSYFHTKKQSKKSGVYFDQMPSIRSNSYVSNQIFKQKQKHTNHDESMSNDDSFALDFDFLLSNRQKKEIKKNLHLSKGKAQNTKEIEQELKLQHREVLSYFIRKWNIYGDIYMFEGELESLKNRFVEVETQEGKRKVYDRIKVKLSCERELITAPETIGRIYLSQVVFLSQNQATIIPEYLLRTVQKSRRRGRN